MNGKTILVVDDERDILELLRYNLVKNGYKVISALTGEEALRLAAQTPPSLQTNEAWLALFSAAASMTMFLSYGFWRRLTERRGLGLAGVILGRGLVSLHTEHPAWGWWAVEASRHLRVGRLELIFDRKAPVAGLAVLRLWLAFARSWAMNL